MHLTPIGFFIPREYVRCNRTPLSAIGGSPPIYTLVHFCNTTVSGAFITIINIFNIFLNKVSFYYFGSYQFNITNNQTQPQHLVLRARGFLVSFECEQSVHWPPTSGSHQWIEKVHKSHEGLLETTGTV